MKRLMEWCVPASALRFDQLTTGGILQGWQRYDGEWMKVIWSDGSMW